MGKLNKLRRKKLKSTAYAVCVLFITFAFRSTRALLKHTKYSSVQVCTVYTLHLINMHVPLLIIKYTFKGHTGTIEGKNDSGQIIALLM